MALRLKEALVKAGKIPATDNKRGRPSVQYKEWAQDLVDNHGYDIIGFVKSGGSAPSTPASVVKPTAAAPKPKSGGIVDVPDEVRSESLWNAYLNDKRVGMREVCVNCSNSLTYCRCGTPMLWVRFDLKGPVTFKPKQSKGDK